MVPEREVGGGVRLDNTPHHTTHHILTAARRSEKLADVFRANNLKVATQKYTYHVSNRTIAGENVYAILQGPRADATEAVVLIGAWKNMADETNTSGVALVLTLARYFKRWSLWSKDIIFLVSGDSTAGPQAWVDAYHDAHDEQYVEGLKIKSGALQAAVAVDYPAGPWGHRYDKLHVLYDGVNGQLPNLDLFNTAVQIASSQMGIGCAIQRMFDHRDSYQERLQTMLRGMLNQGLGHATGPHSSFMAYHVDAITLSTVGDGWHDEMSLGKTIESLFRSLNNLLEHLHQSFFFYLLIQANRFISIGTYLPSAMLIAVSFSISSIGLWIASGRADAPPPNPASTKPSPPTSTVAEKQSPSTPQVQLLEADDGVKTILPVASTTITERPLLTPLLFVLTTHALGLVPLYLFNTWPSADSALSKLSNMITFATLLSPYFLSAFLTALRPPTTQQIALAQCFSLLLLGMFLAALATLNFSQSFLVGLVCVPLAFVRKRVHPLALLAQVVLLMAVHPLVATMWGSKVLHFATDELFQRAAEGWVVNGVWTQVTVWLVWFPAWFVGFAVVALGSWEGVF